MTHSEFLRHQEARLLALWLGPPKTELGPDGRSFVHTFLPGGSLLLDLGPGRSNVESAEEADRRLRDEECRGRG